MSEIVASGPPDHRPLFGRLRHTPLRDLVRGRISGRLDLEPVLAARGLPGPLEKIVRTTTRRSRLWRAEKIDVADELAAHFIEGLEAGESVDDLSRTFGDPRAAAVLIRRAKRRRRPPAWKALRGMVLVLVAIVLLYVLAGARLFLSRPRPSVDYLAMVAAPAAAVPEDERAWPVYRAGLLRLERPVILKKLHGVMRPGAEGWDEVVAYLEANAEALETIRRAATRRDLGFVVGLSIAEEDRELWPEPEVAGMVAEPVGPTLFATRLPHLAELRKAGRLLALDARRAVDEGRGSAAVADLDAIFGMARHARETPLLINDLVAFALIMLAVDTTGELIADHGDAFTEEDLHTLAHRLATTEELLTVRFGAERLGFADVLQHLYSDDGDGDGHLTGEGLKLFRSLAGGPGRTPGEGWMSALLLPVIDVIDVGRKEMQATYDRLLAELERDAARPRWKWGERTVDRQVETWAGSTIDSARYLPIVLLMPALDKAMQQPEMVRARRDGVLVGIALELHRRRHGAWPEDLDALVPGLLPQVPADRADGRPLRYALVGGVPLVYSAGTDRDDDGGRIATPSDRWPRRAGMDLASRWMSLAAVEAARRDTEAMQPPDGDWILWPRPDGEEDG